MPLYDYKCANHGHFQELATMANSAKPCACPQCGQPSPRVIVIPPQVLAMAPEKRKAHAMNEKARHEPVISTADARLEKQEAHKSCGCRSTRLNNPHPLQQQVVYLADGSKTFPSQRPWMISH